MSLASPVIAGTIRIEPSRLRPRGAASCDDSTLDRLLISLLAHEPFSAATTDSGHRFRAIASDRLSRFSVSHLPEAVVNANLGQLWDDLEAEYDKLEGRVAS